MKIISTNIARNKCIDNGLDCIRMDNLQQIVLIAGKNGAGKTRLLTKIKNAVEQQILPNEVTMIERQIKDYGNAIVSWNQEISRLSDPNITQHLNADQRSKEIKNLENNILSYEQQVNQFNEQLTNSFLKYEGDISKRNVIYFVPKKLDLKDPRSLPPIQVENYSRNLLNNVNIDNLNDGVLSRIQDLHTQYWNATHQNTKLTSEKISEIKVSYENLQNLINELLGINLGSDERNYATLFDFPIGEAHLSDGQKVLLQLAVAIHAHNLKISETILLLDEPENHLHPAAIIDVLEKLKSTIPQGQIWIATHSISIIAHFSEESSLYYLDSGKCTKSGIEKTRVLESLIGNEERIRRQIDFFEEPITHAMTTYASQCLVPPKVIMTGVSDPQMNQIRHVLFSIPEKKMKILDFGAGKGRLISNLIDTSSSIPLLKESINYIALDCDRANSKECKTHIDRLYGESDTRWFCSFQDLLTRHNKGSFDLIVMTNVLHEISPNKWITLFGLSGEITELLSETGFLLLVEDQRIPVGETAHEFGFIVLDTGALKDLYLIAGNDTQILQCSERDGRLKAHLIPKDYLMRCNSESIKKALNTHCQQSKRELELLRSTMDKHNSHLFAFWVHQYTNVHLALESWSDK